MRVIKFALLATLLASASLVQAHEGGLFQFLNKSPSTTSASDNIDPKVRDEVSKKLAATFKNFEFDTIKKSEIPGVYEVYTGGRIVYFAPQQDILIFGEFYRTDGHSITEDKIAAAQVLKAGEIDKSAAMVVGDGSINVLEFVNPDCGYCRAAHQWMQAQGLEKNLKEYVFFMPLGQHPDAMAKAASVICAPPALRRAAYDDLWSGRPLDPSKALSCDGAASKLAAQAKEAIKFGVQGTPTWVVKGQVVMGFKQDQLQSLFNGK